MLHLESYKMLGSSPNNQDDGNSKDDSFSKQWVSAGEMTQDVHLDEVQRQGLSLALVKAVRRLSKEPEA
jgi:hypothetical protein